MASGIVPEQPRPGSGSTPGSGQSHVIPDISSLRHPYEHSRLLAALSATTIVLGGLAIATFALAGPVGLAIIILGFGSLGALIWLGLQIYRSLLFGGAIKVSEETLPRLSGIIESVRQGLDYRRRVDVYVADKGPDPITMWNYMGTRIILIEGALVADLQEEEKQKQLVFLLGSMFGRLKARHHQMALVDAWIEGQENLVGLRMFFAPYFRATTYSGDQIGASCCGDVAATAALMNRLLVGKELSPSLATQGALDQAAVVHSRWLPRYSQLFMNMPHLTNRYLNLLAFLAKTSPEATAAYLNTLDDVARQRISAVLSASPHYRPSTRRKEHAQTLAAVTVTALFLVGAGLVLVKPADPVPYFVPTPIITPTSAAPTTESDVERLRAYIPKNFSSSCVAGRETDPDVLAGLVTELSCAPGVLGPSVVNYLQYQDRASMERAFSSLSGAPNVPSSTCSRLTAGTNTYTSSSTGATGRFACYQTGDKRRAFIWTDASRQVLVYSADGEMSFGQLRQWWESRYGKGQ
jgi:hypothetical protein